MGFQIPCSALSCCEFGHQLTRNPDTQVNIAVFLGNAPVPGHRRSGHSRSTINRQRDADLWIFVQGNGNVPFDPAANWVFVRFKDGGNVTRGSTSVAVRTQ